jgi:thymidylate kinase
MISALQNTTLEDQSNIIEFIGPRGSGKSTIYNALFKKKPQTKIFPKESFLPNKKNQRLLNRKKQFDYNKLLQSSFSFCNLNNAFIHNCWEILSEKIITNEDQDNRFRIAKNLYDYYGIYHSIISSSKDKLCIADELILHTLLQITSDEELNKKHLDLFVKNLLIPKAVVHFDAPGQILAERSIKRKIVKSQENKDYHKLIKIGEIEREKCFFLNNYLVNRNVPVIIIDTTKHINDLTNEVAGFVESL